MCLLTFISYSPQLWGFPNISPYTYVWGGRRGAYTRGKKESKKCMGLFSGDLYTGGTYFRGFTKLNIDAQQECVSKKGLNLVII